MAGVRTPQILTLTGTSQALRAEVLAAFGLASAPPYANPGLKVYRTAQSALPIGLAGLSGPAIRPEAERAGARHRGLRAPSPTGRPAGASRAPDMSPLGRVSAICPDRS